MFWMLFGIFSFLLLIFFVIFIFATGIGKDALGRWKNKGLVKKGGFTNALMFSKDGMLFEHFTRNIEGKFKWNDQHYIRVPKLSFPYKGIPTQAYIEGNPSPIDIYDLDKDGVLSCNELDKVMYQNMNFDFKEWFSKNAIFLLLGAGILVLLLVINLYFGYSAWEWVRDSGSVVAGTVSSTMVNASSIA